jgi:hypothetical protein
MKSFQLTFQTVSKVTHENIKVNVNMGSPSDNILDILLRLYTVEVKYYYQDRLSKKFKVKSFLSLPNFSFLLCCSSLSGIIESELYTSYTKLLVSATHKQMHAVW